mmetsp:Transcript_23042/g.76421  ORF Transcript_23042/g.76421 Transcript_23042/m.76421 type:complete len:248 (-) Transcript_23042:161-904(-)
MRPAEGHHEGLLQHSLDALELHDPIPSHIWVALHHVPLDHRRQLAQLGRGGHPGRQPGLFQPVLPRPWGLLRIATPVASARRNIRAREGEPRRLDRRRRVLRDGGARCQSLRLLRSAAEPASAYSSEGSLGSGGARTSFAPRRPRTPAGSSRPTHSAVVAVIDRRERFSLGGRARLLWLASRSCRIDAAPRGPRPMWVDAVGVRGELLDQLGATRESKLVVILPLLQDGDQVDVVGSLVLGERDARL